MMNDLNNFLLLDAARIEVYLEKAKDFNSTFDSLYRGRSEEELVDVAPYLFSFRGNEEFASWIFENGWGNSWGVIVISKLSFEECWRHFRKFLLVKTEDNEELYFRFYDPRVLKIFLPTCDEKQIIEFFGPIESFVVEGDCKEEAIRFWHLNGLLKEEALPSAKVFGEPIIMTSVI